MLITIVRALFVFVMLCLVSAARPMARPIYDNPHEARLDVAKNRVELRSPPRDTREYSRRDGVDRDRDRDQRANTLAVLAAPFTIVPPSRTLFLDELRAATRAVIPIICARSSRGPPAG